MQLISETISTNGIRGRRLKWPRRPILLLGLGLLVTSGILVALRDVAPPQVGDLSLSFSEVLPDRNAFFSVKAAAKAMTLRDATGLNPIISYLKDGPVDGDLIDGVIAANKEPLRQIGHGLTIDKWEWPTNECSEDDESFWYRVESLMRAEAKHLRASGPRDEALASALRVLRLGDMMMQAPRNRGHWWLGCGIRFCGLELCEKFARGEAATASELFQIAQALDQLTSPSESLIYMAKAEYWTLDSLIGRIERREISLRDLKEPSGLENYVDVEAWSANLLFRPNDARTKIANWQRAIISNSTRNYASVDVEMGTRASDLLKSRYFKCDFGYAGAVSAKLQARLTDVRRGFLEYRCFSDCISMGIRTLVAVRLYEMESSRLPAVLNDLVPKFLSAVPVDPYDGEPFRYLPGQRILYSVGKDLVDSGGSNYFTVQGKPKEVPREDSRDIVFRCFGPN